MMTPRQAIKLLNALGDMIEDDWANPDDYLEAIGLAQDALRDTQEHSEQHV